MSSLFKTFLDRTNFRNFQTIDQVNHWANIFVTRFAGIFSTKTILPPTHKESLPASSSNCVVYEIKCECRSRYVGRTNQTLSYRREQHVPSVIRNKTQPSPQHPEQQCRSSHFISCDPAVGRHFCLISLALKPTQTVNLEFFTNAVPPCHQFLRPYKQVIGFYWVSRHIALGKWSAEMHRALS